MSQSPANYRSEIQAIIDAFTKAANAKDANTLAGFYADDATLLPPGQPAIKGKDNIRNFWQDFLNAGAGDAALKIVSVDGSGDLVYEIGEWAAIMPSPGGGTAPATGKYLVVYKRQPDGKLKMVADMFGPNA
jgi:uncharacterized protein (TIGR02246 family)